MKTEKREKAKGQREKERNTEGVNITHHNSFQFPFHYPNVNLNISLIVSLYNKHRDGKEHSRERASWSKPCSSTRVTKYNRRVYIGVVYRGNGKNGSYYYR